MAIGDFGTSNGSYGQNGNSDNNKLFEYTYYSRYRIRNNEPDEKSINIIFHGGLLKFALQRKANYKFEDISDMYFSPMKARLMAEQVDAFIEYYKAGKIEENKSFGVYGGMGERTRFCGISAKKDKTITMSFGKIDNDGKVVEYEEFNFARDYHMKADWKDITKNDVTPVYDDLADVFVLRDVLADFGRSMTGAVAYSVMDGYRWDYARMINKMNPIFDKLGIERKATGGNGYSGGSNSFLANLGKGPGLNTKSSGNSSSFGDDIVDVFEE